MAEESTALLAIVLPCQQREHGRMHACLRVPPHTLRFIVTYATYIPKKCMHEMHACTQTDRQRDTPTHTARMNACMHPRTNDHTHTRTQTQTVACLIMPTHTCSAHTCFHAYKHTCLRTCLYTYIHIFICTYSDRGSKHAKETKREKETE